MSRAREIATTLAIVAGIWVMALATGFVAASLGIGLLMILMGKEMTTNQQLIFGASIVIFTALQLVCLARKP